MYTGIESGGILLGRLLRVFKPGGDLGMVEHFLTGSSVDGCCWGSGGDRGVSRRGSTLGLCVDRMDVAGKCYKYPARLEFQSVGRTGRFVILQVDRTACRRR